MKSREERDVPGLLDCEDETSVNVYQSTRSNITGDFNRKPFSVSAFVQAITKCCSNGSIRSICSSGHKMLCSNGSVRSISTSWKSPGPLS